MGERGRMAKGRKILVGVQDVQLTHPSVYKKMKPRDSKL
jgi:hypothetical protein